MKDFTFINIYIGPSGANLPRSGAGPRRIVYSSEDEDDAPVRPTAFGYLAEPQSIDDSDSDDHPPAFGPSSIARIPPSPMDDSDSDDQLPARISPTLSRRRRTARRNQFIDSEAGVDGAASEDEDDDDDDDLGGFIVDDDVIF